MTAIDRVEHGAFGVERALEEALKQDQVWWKPEKKGQFEVPVSQERAFWHRCLLWLIPDSLNSDNPFVTITLRGKGVNIERETPTLMNIVCGWDRMIHFQHSMIVKDEPKEVASPMNEEDPAEVDIMTPIVLDDDGVSDGIGNNNQSDDAFASAIIPEGDSVDNLLSTPLQSPDPPQSIGDRQQSARAATIRAKLEMISSDDETKTSGCLWSEVDYVLIAVRDAESEVRRDRMIGECLITSKGSLALSPGEKRLCRAPIFDLKKNEECGVIWLSLKMGDDGDSPSPSTSSSSSSFTLTVECIEGLTDEYANEVKDNPAESLVQSIMALFGWISWLLISSGIYLWAESNDKVNKSLSYGDWIYFCITSATTVGYGDITPNTRIGKLMNALFVVVDAVIIGWVLSLLMTRLLALREKREAELEDEQAAKEAESQTNNNHNKNNKDDQRLKKQQSSILVADGILPEEEEDFLEEERRGFLYRGLILCLLLISGTLVFTIHEGFGFADAFHWNFVTMSTVGYGDVTPNTRFGKAFTSLYMLIGVYTLAQFVTDVLDWYNEKQLRAAQQNRIEKALINEEQLLEFDKDGNGEIDKFEFLSKMLIETGECDESVIDEVMSKFYEIDDDGSGFITTEELRSYEQRLRKEQRELQSNGEEPSQLELLVSPQKCCSLCG